jgi:hypothetical protein
MIVDPLAAMASACIAIANGEANEIEMNWTKPVDGTYDESLTIIVRREVRHYNYTPPAEPGDLG